MPALAFPQSEATDPDPVADALDAGLLHWAKSETVDALKCLRQARDAADDAGLDRRALDLARAAAELAQQDTATPLSSPAASDAQPSEPRRSRLPEPPAPSKKYVTAGATEGSSGTAAASRTGAMHGSLTPGAAKASSASAAKSPVTSAASLSGRPAPPSTRPSASPSGAPATGHLGLRDAATPQSAATSPRPSAAPTPKTEPNTTEHAKIEHAKIEHAKIEHAKIEHAKIEHAKIEHAKIEHAKIEHAKIEHAKLANEAASPTQTRQQSTGTSHAPTEAEARLSSRPDALDHRLASLRVRIERVDPDGTVRLKLLDLAATAGGEDNALLIVPQSVWQELKRHS